MSDIELSVPEVEYLLSARAVRERAQAMFALCESGKTAFRFHPEKLPEVLALVLKTIKENYPSLDIPFHSRWGHFRAGGIDRVKLANQKLDGLDPMEKARCKLDLVITSVLLDAGAGAVWSYNENGLSLNRSEGLGVASFHMFMAGVFSSDRSSPRADAEGLGRVTAADLRKYFQVTEGNPLVGVEGRVQLLNNLGHAVSRGAVFRDGRPGSIIDHLVETWGRAIPATRLLRAVLDGFGPIWPGRLTAGGVSLGDVWRHSGLGRGHTSKSLVPLHKLSQWMTYSLIEPIREAGIEVTGIEDLTGLAEYRNGGLFIDSGLLTLRNPEDREKSWGPESDLVIEWRALTVHLLDLVAAEVRTALGKSAADFPLAKVLEGGTWWAGRRLAYAKREDGGSPIQVRSDGTVF